MIVQLLNNMAEKYATFMTRFVKVFTHTQKF